MSCSSPFDISMWVDFARGLRSPAEEAQMRSHAASCLECSQLMELFSRLWTVSRQMSQDAVPEEWIRNAEQIVQSEMISPIRELPSRAAMLTFDSFAAAAPAHVRSGLQSARHLIYETDDCALDLQLDASEGRDGLSLIGQITDRRKPEKSLPTVPVFLFAGNKVVASTSSNEFGEFRMTSRLRRKMRISFPYEGSRIDVRLETL